MTKRPIMPLTTALGRILVTRRFACPINRWASCCLMSFGRRSSSITKSAARISQERFDLESPSFTQTSMPTHSTATPDRASPAPFGRHLSTFAKNAPAENAASDDFDPNFTGAAFFLAQPIGGIFVKAIDRIDVVQYVNE